MDYAYAAADFIISRAGASSVSELCVVGKPVVFIPSPNGHIFIAVPQDIIGIFKFTWCYVN